MAAENDIEVSTRAENANASAAVTAASTPTSATTITTIEAAAAAVSAAADLPKSTAMNLNANLQLISNGENNGKAAEAAQQQQQQQQMHAESSNKDKMDSGATLANFKVLYVVTQLCGLTMIVLVGSWLGVHMGGFAGTSNPKLEFNWHPLLMTIGLIFLYGNSILIYRGCRSTRKKTLKITHAAIHMGAFILTVIALQTAFDSHNLNERPIPNMYSLHSWLGLSAVILFCLQFVAGFMAYMVPGLRESYKIAYMPLHIYFGLFGFVLAIASALMGLCEKVIFSVPEFSTLPSSGAMANTCGVFFVIFGGLVVYLATEPAYKRKPIPEDTVLLTGANE